MTDEHYLKAELQELLRSDPSIFEFIQKGSLDGIWYWDLESGEDEWMSPQLWETFGYDPKTKAHRASEWQDIIHPEDLQVALANFEQHAKDPDHPYDQIVRYRHRDGSTVWVRCRGLIIRDAAGTPRRMLGAHTDVTQLHVALQESERLRERAIADRDAQRALTEALARSNDELQRFASVASHDLREPLRRVSGYTQIALETGGETLGPEVRRYLTLALDGAKQMDALIEDLLLIAQVGASDLERVPVDLNRAVGDVLALLSVPIERSGATVTCDPLPTVHGDAAQLGLLFRNLVSNAVKYRNDKPPEIRVRAEEHSNEWVIRVEDNGIGFPEESAREIFGMFKRLHARSKFPGTGIGLSIAARIAERHAGRIWAKGKPGQGSTFFVALPRNTDR